MQQYTFTATSKSGNTTFTLVMTASSRIKARFMIIESTPESWFKRWTLGH